MTTPNKETCEHSWKPWTADHAACKKCGLLKSFRILCDPFAIESSGQLEVESEPVTLESAKAQIKAFNDSAIAEERERIAKAEANGETLRSKPVEESAPVPASFEEWHQKEFGAMPDLDGSAVCRVEHRAWQAGVNSTEAKLEICKHALNVIQTESYHGFENGCLTCGGMNEICCHPEAALDYRPEYLDKKPSVIADLKTQLAAKEKEIEEMRRLLIGIAQLPTLNEYNAFAMHVRDHNNNVRRVNAFLVEKAKVAELEGRPTKEGVS